MVKIKNKKRNLSEKVNNNKIKDTSKKKQLNPFEVHINKDKMPVLGRKLKNDRGLPGISRAKAIKKRKITLLQEYKQQNKTNQFVDKRIGEKSMNENDRITARFTAVRMKQHKQSIFNLPDDEIQLTHKGQTLSEIEKFDDPRSDEDDDDTGYDLKDKDKGRLDAKFVDDAHFGGGIFNKTTNDGAKTHRDLIDQLIAESKKRKAEKQKMKEATLELTEQLDNEWKDLLPLVNKQQRRNDDDQQQHKEKLDDYDRIMKELKFEARGMATDRLKTEDELAKEEKEKLEELERERLERMKGLTNDGETNQTKHRSADDLDDDFVYESDQDNILTYNEEGEANIEIDAQLNGKEIGKNRGADDVEEEEEEDDDNNNEEDIEDEEEEEEEKEEDNLSDLKAESSDEDTTDETPDEIQDKIKKDLLKRKEMMDKARDELPFTFNLPDSYENLQKLFENRSGLHHGIILERMLKCNHPSLGKDNKENLSMLFAYLLQYLNDCANDAINDELLRQCFDIFTNITPTMYELAKLNPENTHHTICEVIKEKQEEFRKKSKTYPGLELLVFLKLISLLFTTSDFRHQVVTPCFVFIEQLLNKCRVKTRRDISYGLFLCTVVLEYTSLSKRYMPAVINYLGGILHMAIPKLGVKLIKIQPPFRSTSTDLVLVDDLSEDDFDIKMNINDLLSSNKIDDNFKCRSLYLCLKLIEEFDNNFKSLPSNIQIFNDIVNYLKQININNYPKKIQEEYQRILEQLEQRRLNKKLEYVRMPQQRPKALRMLEPKIEEVFDSKRRRVQSKEKAEREKLLHKLKRETKGALREIRRDKSFLGRVKIQQQLQSDRERREKVKKLYSEAALQQSELNAIDRKNKKKK